MFSELCEVTALRKNTTLLILVLPIINISNIVINTIHFINDINDHIIMIINLLRLQFVLPIAYRRRGAWGGGAPEPQWATAAAGPGGAPPEPPWATAALGPGVGHLVISLWSCPLLQINDYSAPCILFPRILYSLYPLPSSFPLHPRLFSSSEIVRPCNSASPDQFTLRLLPSQGSRFGAVPMRRKQ